MACYREGEQRDATNIKVLRTWEGEQRGCSLEKNSWDAEPGRARRPARTGVFIVAGGASSAMNDYEHMGPTDFSP